MNALPRFRLLIELLDIWFVKYFIWNQYTFPTYGGDCGLRQTYKIVIKTEGKGQSVHGSGYRKSHLADILDEDHESQGIKK